MDNTVLFVMAALVFVWGAVSLRFSRADLTAPIVFVTVGGLLGWFGIMDAPSAPETLVTLVEVTLVWVLFSDAARIQVGALRADLGLFVRLLAVGLPLTILAGWGLAAWMMPGLGIWLALLVGSALAPTDAALGVPVVTNPVVPSRIRRVITVESGLNDGIATPIVMLAIAAAASAEGLEEAPGLAEALAELAIGAVVGVVIGLIGGWLLGRARKAGWAAEDFMGVAVLALSLVAYAGSIAVGGNGFVAAFCGGLAFGAAAGKQAPKELEYLEQTGGLVSLLVWLAFGVVAIPAIIREADVMLFGYAVLSLTVVRMIPVALSLLGTRLDRDTVLFIGWFGPRGLASIVFALLALEELGSEADAAVAVIGVTVLLSVVAHGFSAAPLAARYGASAAARGTELSPPMSDLPVRGLPGRLPVAPVAEEQQA